MSISPPSPATPGCLPMARFRRASSSPGWACSPASTAWREPCPRGRPAHDGGGPPAGRAGPDGRAVQGTGADDARSAHSSRIRSMTPLPPGRRTRRPPRLLHPRGRRVHGPVRQPQLQPVQRRRPGARVPRTARRSPRRVGVEHLVGVHQVHGAEVARVDEPWAPGQGPRADAMVTRRPGLGLAIITADCAPVLFAAPGVVGAAHAGWRGRAGRGAGGGGRGHGRAGTCTPRSARASATAATRSPPTCATPCWHATRPMRASSPTAGRSTGCSICRATAPHGSVRPGRRSPCWAPTRWPTRRGSSAIAAARLQAAARSAIRSPSSHAVPPLAIVLLIVLMVLFGCVLN